jgi:(5-formylfuran-3-yl)methyl phosphate synthase
MLSLNHLNLAQIMTGMLASVSDVEEALLALAAGADVVDFKNPAAGALGALSPETVHAAVARLRGRVATSATLGDLPADPSAWHAAVQAMRATGVDYLKLGLFPAPDLADRLATLRPLTRESRLIIVLFADRDPDFDLLPAIRAAGCTGVMLDTADKRSGRLTDHLDETTLGGFLRRARLSGLLTGLAGSLRLEDIPRLLPLAPDYLGFRGALCGGDRRAMLDPVAVGRVRAAIPAARQVVSA